MANEGQRFFGIYFFSAVVGSILIIFGAPFVLLPDNLPAPVAQAFAWLDQNAALKKLSVSLHSALAWQVPPVLPAICTPPENQANGTVSLPPPPSNSAPPRSRAPVPALAPVPSPVVTGSQETVVSPPEPASASVPPADSNRWGIVKVPETKVYTKQGKFMARVAVGTLLEIRDLITAEVGVFALGTVISPTNRFEDALVATNDLEIRIGAFSDVSESEKDLRGARARLQAELTLRKAGPSKYLRKDNPFATNYARIRQEYVEYWKKERALQVRRDASEGEDHMRIMDELRMMKGDDFRLGQAYEEVKKTYSEWDQAHPEPSGQEKLEVDAITEDMARIQSDLEALGAP